MTRIVLSHVTTYRYSRPAALGPQLIRLRPAAHARARIEAYRLAIRPEAHTLRWQQDPFGNWVGRLTLAGPAPALEVAVELAVRLDPVNPFDFLVEDYAFARPFAYPPELRSDLAPFLAVDGEGPLFAALAARFSGGGGETVPFLVALNAAVRAGVRYLRRMEPGTRAPEETLAAGEGSCRDSAWLLVQLLRRLGFAARFVSGYSIQLADGDQVPEDTADLHAWAEAFVPGAGWIGLDPTSGLLTAEGHVPLAATARYQAAAPMEGAVFGDGVEAAFDVAIDVRRAPA